MTPEDVEAEYWAHYYTDTNVKEEFEDDAFDAGKLAAAAATAAESGEDIWESLIDDKH